MITASDLPTLLCAEFPDLCEEVQGDDGFTNMVLASFALYTQSAIDNRDVVATKKCFAFADRLDKESDAELTKAFLSSYLMRLEFADGQRNRAWAKEHLPLRFLRMIEIHEEFLGRLFRRQYPG